MRKRFRLSAVAILAVAAVLPGRAWAQARADVVENYALYILGVRTADMRAHLMFDAAGYALDITTKTSGVAEMFVKGDQAADVTGGWTDSTARPRRYATTGTWNGDPHRTTIEFSDGMPNVTLRVPPEKKDHLPIPSDLLRDSLDSLSGFAALVRQVARTGKCDRQGFTFDGLHVLDVTARTAGEEMLPRDADSSFSGRALRCDFEGHMIAGFTRGDENKQRKVLHATAWLARLTPEGPPMPVRAKFETRYFGDAVVYLVPPPAAATQ